MKNSWPLYLTLVSLVVVVGFLSHKIHSTFNFPFPPFNTLVYDLSDDFKNKTTYQRPLGSQAGYRDLSGLLLGMRRFTADIAWISVLQYYGGRDNAEDDHGEESHHHGSGRERYPALKKMVQRTVRLDPSFHFAALMGSGALAFTLDRPQEGLELLEEAIRRNPTFWRYRLYAGAILYKQKGRFKEMTVLLEDAISFPDCPTLIKSILANIYKERGQFTKALEIWLEVYENDKTDNWYMEKAEKQIDILRRKIGI